MIISVRSGALGRAPASSWRRRAGPIFAAVMLAAGIVGGDCSRLCAAEPQSKASNSRAARDEAIRSIPFDKLAPETRGKLAAVINDVTLFRRLPIQAVDCEPELFQFLAANPDVVVNIWRVMGVTNVSLERLEGDAFRCADGDGTTARTEIVFRNHNTMVVYGEGFYEGPLFPRPVRGQCVAVLKTACIRETNGRFYVTARLDTFLHVENVGLELLARMFQGLVGRTIDHNFAETVGFLGSVSRTAETNPPGMQRLASRLNQVEPQRRDQFAAVAEQVPHKLAGVRLADADDNPALTDVVRSASLHAPKAPK